MSNIARIVVIECAWCKAVMGKKSCHGKHNETSSVCPSCVKKYFPNEYDEFMKLREADAEGEEYGDNRICQSVN